MEVLVRPVHGVSVDFLAELRDPLLSLEAELPSPAVAVDSVFVEDRPVRVNVTCEVPDRAVGRLNEESAGVPDDVLRGHHGWSLESRLDVHDG